MPITLSGDGAISGLTATGISAVQTVTSVPSSALPAGSVLQVVSVSSTSVASTTSTSFVDTGISRSITPTSATSKILVLVTISGIEKPSSANESVSLALLRGATNIFGQTNIMLSSTAMPFVCESNMIYLDSPATTSATTYKLQFRSRLGGTIKINQDNNFDYTTITLLEIAS